MSTTNTGPVAAPAPVSGVSVLPLLRRGLAAGGIAGLAAGLFSLLLAEPLMDRAVRLEAAVSGEQSEHGHGASTAAHSHAEELFSRGEQHLGLVVTAVVTGLALGVFFAVVYALTHRRDSGAHPWPRALALAGAGFTGVSLLPFLRYPANPPGVGDGSTVVERQVLWVSAIAIGVLGMLLVHQLDRRLAQAGHGAPVRQSVAVVTVAVVLAVLFLLPGNPDPVDVSATLLWDFRVLSLGSQALLWAALGAAFGALGLRAAKAAA
jgi:predicted cobalt transporter CbtA